LGGEDEELGGGVADEFGGRIWISSHAIDYTFDR